MYPICFFFLGRPIYWYGIMMALAFLAAILHWSWLGRRCGRAAHFGYDLAFWLMLAGILGARINYVIANITDFVAAPLTIIRVDQGGLIYYGGFVCAALTAVLFAWRHNEQFAWFADFVITAIPLGHFFGRIGCFLNGCCYGSPGNYAWCFPLGEVTRHPVQLYESLWNLMVYLVLLRVFFKRKTAGVVFCLYLILYPMGRFGLEFWRGDPRLTVAGLTTAQVFSLVLVVLGIGLWLLLHWRNSRMSTVHNAQADGDAVNGGQR